MKKILFIIFLFSKTITYGCDFCNCYIGLNPKYKSNLIGLQFSSMYSEGSHRMEDAVMYSDLNMKMYKQEYDLTGQLIPFEKFQVYFSIPYINSRQIYDEQISEAHIINHHGADHTFIYNHSQNSEQTYSGFGDPLVIFHYQLLNNESPDSNTYNYRVLGGGGVKFPVGKSTPDAADPHQSRTHLPGTGSWDYIASLRYLSQYKKFGFNINSNYKFTTTNSDSYKFGNSLNLNGTFIYNVTLEDFMIYPNAGLYFESAGEDKFISNKIEDSGGDIILYHIGADFNYKSFYLNAAFQFPMHQNLNGVQPETKSKFMVGIAYAFD